MYAAKKVGIENTYGQIAYVNGVGSAGGAAGSVTLSLVPVPGNLLVAIIYGATASTSTFSSVESWKLELSSINNAACGNVAVYSHIALGDGGETQTNYGFIGNPFLCGVILQFSGAAGLDNVPGVTLGTTATTACTAPASTPKHSRGVLIAFFGSAGGDTFTTPSGMTAVINAASTGEESIYTFYQNGSTTSPPGGASSRASTQSASDSYIGGSFYIRPS